MPEEPIEKRARPDKLFKLGSMFRTRYVVSVLERFGSFYRQRIIVLKWQTERYGWGSVMFFNKGVVHFSCMSAVNIIGVQ